MSQKRDLSGQRFCKWVVLHQDTGKDRWLCRCDCGNEKSVNEHSLLRGGSTSCGCGRHRSLTGQRFERLVVREMRHDNRYGKPLWICVCDCDCGNTIEVTPANLRAGHTMSCGCLNRELAASRLQKHGRTNTRLYRIFRGMKQRCENHNDKSYARYCARGIYVCEEWSEFEKFEQWALNHGYRDDLSIDRVDVDGPYAPSNCRWATALEQQQNTRRPIRINYNGETHTLSEWSQILGIDRDIIYRQHCKGTQMEDIIADYSTKR